MLQGSQAWQATQAHFGQHQYSIQFRVGVFNVFQAKDPLADREADLEPPMTYIIKFC